MAEKKPGSVDEDEHIGAVEGDRPTDSPNQGNPNGPGVDDQGKPNDPVGTAEDRIGANQDEAEGG
ncbi:MAG: hypothetical protein H0W18_04605 [Acidobacteria bacterium]|nr:hypothetical protein [Acidobacteriota bacterium]